MLHQRCVIEDLDLDQWQRLSHLGLASRRQRRFYVVHEGGKVVRALDTTQGEQPLPADKVDDAQALADKLYAAKQAEGVEQVWVLDLQSFHAEMAKVQSAFDPKAGMDLHLDHEHQARLSATGCGVAPKTDFLLYGLPWGRLSRFAQKMMPPACIYVLGVFDGDQLWATLFVQFKDQQIVGISTSAALDPDDVKDIIGRDQHPFLLTTVANRYRSPAFGWFCQREDFEAYMLATTVEAKDEVFQKALMANRATFDFNILIDRGITPLGPMNPGEAALAGAEREDNPRTALPDPSDPGPSAV